MPASPPLRRLIDLPGIAELERKALMKPAYADEACRAEFPEIDETALKAFGGYCRVQTVEDVIAALHQAR